MSPAKLSSNERDQILEKLIAEVQSAEESYRLMKEQYVRVMEGFLTPPDDPQAVQTVYLAAKDTRMARKRYRRAYRVLTGFTASWENFRATVPRP